MATTTSGGNRAKSLQLIGLPIVPAGAYGITANATANLTIADQFVILWRIANYEEYLLGAEDTSGLSTSFVSLADLPSLGETTETHNRTRYSLSGLLSGISGYPEVQFGYNAPSESPRMPIQEEEQEIIRADTNRALSFQELLDALDRISRPTEMEDIPLSVDPDDYPIV
jgi:hypothetical protein